MTDYSKLQNGSDIRGVAIEGVPGEAVNLGNREAVNIGYAFAEFLKNKGSGKNIAIGRDPRLSGKTLGIHLAAGIKSNGMDFIDFGIATTPAMFMSTVFPETDCSGAVMITASHLPYNRNGFKFFIPEEGLDKKDITEILKIAEIFAEQSEKKDAYLKDNVISDSKADDVSSCHGDMEELHHPVDKADNCCPQERKENNLLMELYCRHLRNLIIKGCDSGEKPLSEMTVAIDAGNGSGGFFANNVLTPLGAKVHGKYLEPDGTFPNHPPNPENKEAMDAISKAVLESNADLGLIFDTDCDRSAAVDESGKEIARNGIVALAAALIQEKHPNTTVVTDSITSPQLTIFLEKELGMKHLRFKRGYRNVINKAIELNEAGIESHLAIETSGHAAIKDNYFLDDGAYLATLIVIKATLLKSRGESISSMLEKLQEPVESVEIRMNIKGDNFSEIGDEVLSKLGIWIKNSKDMSLVEPNFEGIRANYKKKETEGWFLLRKSLHDSILPLNIESDTIGGTKEIAARLKEFLQKFEAVDTDNL